MSMKTDRLPMSRANLALCGLFVAGVVTTLALGLWAQAIMLALMLLIGVFCIYRARRPGAGDVTRVDALEYRDERDRVIARDGFAVVGVLALLLSLVEYVLVSVLLPDWILVPLGQTALLFVGWGVANRVAARRH